MSYDDVKRRLESLENGDSAPRRVVALPDGSVDHWYAVAGDEGERLETPDALADRLSAGGETFPLERVDVRPGGQAVNAADQLHALGEAVTVVGHLDHPVLSDLPFETRSMGTPAAIRIFAFDDEAVMFPESGPAAEWGLDDLLSVVDWDRLVTADALCCVNWVSVRGLTDVFERLAADPPDERLPLVLDPGSLEAVDPAALDDLFAALAAADASDSPLEVVLSVNPTEFDAAAAAAGVTDADAGAAGDTDAGDDAHATDRLEALRSEIGIAGLVTHGADEAAAAIRDETVTVEMLDLEDPGYSIGAGDRFSAGLACGLAREWPIATAVALGNVCSARFVATGETGDPTDLRTFLEESEYERS